MSPHAPAPTAHSVFLLFLTIFCPPFLVIRFGTCHLCLSHSEYQKIVGGCLRAFEHVTLVKCIIRAVQFYFSSFIILILMYCTRVLYDLTMCCRSGCCFVVRWRHRCLCRRCSLLVAVVARRSLLVARRLVGRCSLWLLCTSVTARHRGPGQRHLRHSPLTMDDAAKSRNLGTNTTTTQSSGTTSSMATMSAAAKFTRAAQEAVLDSRTDVLWSHELKQPRHWPPPQAVVTN